MKILFIRENRDIEVKNVTVKNNQFNINNMLYVIDNPHYFYIKSKLFGITLFKRKLLIFREFSPIAINTENFSFENLLSKQITNKLFLSKTITEIFGNENKDFLILILPFITFIGGYLMARFLWGDNMGIEDTNPIENLFENAEDYNIDQAIMEMLDKFFSIEDIETKTDIEKKDLKKIVKLKIYSNTISDYSPDASSLIDKYVNTLMIYSLSKDRTSRKEFFTSLKALKDNTINEEFQEKKSRWARFKWLYIFMVIVVQEKLYQV